MAQTEREIRPHFSQPTGPGLTMLLITGACGAGAFLALPRVRGVFEANPYLNGFILFVFAVGVLACFWQVLTLIGCVRWIDRFTSGRDDGGVAPRLLAPLAGLLRARGARMQISATSSRSILDSVATRIDEAREITRYIVNLLIFLGLLGTFYGLSITVPAVVDTIRSLTPKEGEDAAEVFNRLMVGMGSQLDGMGIAFASSLLGLAGSLIVGLLELFAGHGQNRFYRELEEWLSSITRLGFSSGDEAGGEGHAMGAVVEALAEQIDGLQRLFIEAESGRAALDERLAHLAETMAGQGAPPVDALNRIAEGQERLLEHLQQNGGEGMDAESRMRLRSIDVQMLRILEEISAGRQESLAALRADLRALGGGAPDETLYKRPGE